MRLAPFRLVVLCAALPSSLSFSGQVVDGHRLNQVELSDLVSPETFATIQPSVFHLHGHDALCYELYIVNMKDTPAELSRVQVLRADGITVLQDKTGRELAAALTHSNAERSTVQKTGTIRSGEQIVFYAWVDLPAGSPAPMSIRHAVTMRQQGGRNMQILTREIAVRHTELELEPPLRGSNWLAANGPSNTSGHRKTVFPLDGNTEVPQRFAIDWLMVKERELSLLRPKGTRSGQWSSKRSKG